MSSALPKTVRTSLAILAATRAIVRRQEEAQVMEERIARVVAIFHQVGTKWALVGAHAIGTLAEPRATSDFDFVVEGSKLGAIMKAFQRSLGISTRSTSDPRCGSELSTST